MRKLFTEEKRAALKALTESKIDIFGDWYDKYYDAMDVFEQEEAQKIRSVLKSKGYELLNVSIDRRGTPNFSFEFYDPNEEEKEFKHSGPSDAHDKKTTAMIKETFSPPIRQRLHIYYPDMPIKKPPLGKSVYGVSLHLD